jgi:hypothetical protein
MFVIPRTKMMASRMFDLPDPFKPVIALNDASHPVIVVRTGYDLKPSSPCQIMPRCQHEFYEPSRMSSSIRIARVRGESQNCGFRVQRITYFMREQFISV